MRTLAHLCRLLVGAVFVFSGLIKLNDPIGTQLKLIEYFEVFAQDFPAMAGFWEALVPYALLFSVLLCMLEVLAGVALLVQWRLRHIAWLLVGLCGFFGFLTFYSAYFNRVTDCGCFGEMIKLSPWTSFFKDIALLVLLLVVVGQRRAFGTGRSGGAFMAAALLLCSGLAFYALHYGPPYDGLPYAEGQNLPQNMKNLRPYRFRYIMTRNGQQQTFDQYPTDTTWAFKEMIGPLNPADGPRITDYRLWRDTLDFTQASFSGKKMFIVLTDVPKAEAHAETLPGMVKLARDLTASGVETYVLIGSSEEIYRPFAQRHGLGSLPYFYADGKVLKTMLRTNPGLWLLHNGTVAGKWSYARLPTPGQVLDRLQR